MGRDSNILVRGRTRGGLAWVSLALGLFAGCASDTTPNDVVYTRERPDAPFASYKTYAIASEDDVPDLPDPPEVPDEIPEDVQQGLKTTQNAVKMQLNMRGLEEVGVDEDPDLYVLDFAATDEQGGIVWECVPGWTWWGWYAYWDPCAWLAPVPVNYSVGDVLVLLADPDIKPDEDTGKFVFGGLAQGLITGSNDGEERINDAVAEMFESYPVPIED